MAERNNVEADARYILINSGNANAGTGAPGLAACEQSCEALANATQTHSSQVLPFSTGVIGELLPVEKLEAAIPAAISDLSAANWGRASKAIMTTDTVPNCAAKL